MSELARHIRALEAQIDQLKRQWPKHSVPAAMLMQLESLEEELAEARQRLAEQHGPPSSPVPGAKKQ